MGGKSSTISTSEPRLGNLRVQTSMYGLAVPWVRGQTRVVGNLLWFGNFQAIAITTSTSQGGGKGGGGVTQVDTRYEYKAAAILALARGLCVGIASAWKGKRRYLGEQVAGRSETLTQNFTVPIGGVINVPLSGGAFAGNLSVDTYDPPAYDNSGNN
jgi:hypothetical protein